MSENISLWASVEKTDPAFTKQFSRNGGFKGTATNATYLARKATEQFGPCGIGWGVQVIDEEIIEGAPFLLEGIVVGHERIHKVRARLWYVRNGERGEVEQFGQTQVVGRNKNGFYTDEEAPKKSLTDAMSKCLSLLGFSADIHLGLYDDNKYVAGLKAEFAANDSAAPGLSATGKVSPADGVWDALDQETQAFLLKCAAHVVQTAENVSAEDAVDYIESQQLTTEEKTALWTRLDSKVRTALKKAAANKKEAA